MGGPGSGEGGFRPGAGRKSEAIRRKQLANRDVVMRTVTEEDLVAITRKAVQQARDGDFQARIWVSAYTVGKPSEEARAAGELEQVRFIAILPPTAAAHTLAGTGAIGAGTGGSASSLPAIRGPGPSLVQAPALPAPAAAPASSDVSVSISVSSSRPGAASASLAAPVPTPVPTPAAAAAAAAATAWSDHISPADGDADADADAEADVVQFAGQEAAG